MNRKRALYTALLVLTGLAVWMASAAGAESPSAIANITPTKVKIRQSGTTMPGSSWTEVGRLQLPVGSWVVQAHLTAYSIAPATTPLECYLTAPNAAAGHALVELGATKGTNADDISLIALSNAPNGGNADLVCKVSALAADRRVFAEGIVVAATSVSGATVTHSAPPSTVSS